MVNIQQIAASILPAWVNVSATIRMTWHHSDLASKDLASEGLGGGENRFGVAVACPAETADQVRSLLTAAGAEEVRR